MPKLEAWTLKVGAWMPKLEAWMPKRKRPPIAPIPLCALIKAFIEEQGSAFVTQGGIRFAR
jgi:hypothetical protein